MDSTTYQLSLDDPGELLETLPYVLGFRPADSVVLVGLSNGKLAVAVRSDLDCADHPPVLVDGLRVLRQSKTDRVVIVVYSADRVGDVRRVPHDRPLPNEALIDHLTAAIEAAGIAVLDALLAADGHWWSYVGRAAGCVECSRGTRLPGDAARGPATAVLAGLQTQPSRAALEAVLDPQPDDQRERRRPALAAAEQALERAGRDGQLDRARRSVKRAIFAAARESDAALFPRPTTALADATLGRFGVALADITIRDAVWVAIDQGRIDGRGLWQLMLQRLPAPADNAPLFLFGWASWREGNGTLARIAAERVLASTPGYTAAELLLGALGQGLDPFRTPRLRMPARGR